MAEPDTEAGPIRVLVVDDDPLVRNALTMMLGGLSDISVLGEATDGTEVESAVDTHVPDVVLMDIRMPKVDGLVATELLRRRARPPEIIVLTTFDTDEHVVRALRAGASGFLLKDTAPAQLVEAVRRVAAGEPILSPTVTRQLIDQITDPAEDDKRRAQDRLAALSERERDVALALGQGQANAEIAAALYMSVPTVKAHITRILTKLDMNNRVQIALLAHDASREQ